MCYVCATMTIIAGVDWGSLSGILGFFSFDSLCIILSRKVDGDVC